MEWGLGLSQRIVAANNNQILIPPPTPQPLPPTKWHPGIGGGEVKSKKFTVGLISSPKMMILQGVEHRMSYSAVCCANTPRKREYVALTPALDLTTLFEGDFRKLSRKRALLITSEHFD